MLREKSQTSKALAANQRIKERNFWLTKLSGEINKVTFPRCNKRAPGEQSRRGRGPGKKEHTGWKISEELYTRLMGLSNKKDSILHMILTAGLNLLLYRCTGSRDIIVGTPIYKQDTSIEEEFINTVLALRNRLESEATFKQLLVQVKETILEATENYAYPIEMLPGELNLPPSNSEDGFPLFDIVLLLENIQDKAHIRQIKNNITFSFQRKEKYIEGTVTYNAEQYDKVMIERIIGYLTTLMKNGLSEVDAKLSHIEMLTGEEKKQLLEEFNATSAAIPGDKVIHYQVEEQVKKTPHETAVIEEDGTRTLTYRELNEKANRLAHLLRKKGEGPDRIIGIMMDNSLEMIIGILAVLKAGGAYLPIGPGLPEKRVIAMLNDSNAALLLTKDKLIGKFKFTTLQDFEKGRIKKIVTPKRPQVMDLDSLQLPDRSLVDYEKYHPYIGQSMVKNSVTLQFSRGCIFKCLYCFKIWPDKYALRTGENLYEEVEMYYKMGIRRFGFTDDLPNFNKKEISKFYRLVIKNKLKIHMHFPNGIRGDILTPEFIDMMMEAGAVTMDLALETASPRLQKLIRKNVNIDRLRRNVQYIIENYPQAILGVQIMHGFPTETEEEARASLEFIKSFRWLPFGYMHILKIYPNTNMARFAMENGVTEEEIIRSMDLAYHELPYTLPFPENFTRQCQSQYLGDFFLNRERLVNVLPNQMAMLTEDELVQKYNSYLPVDIKTFQELLKYIGISRDEIKGDFLPDGFGKVEHFKEKVRAYFPVHSSDLQAARILLLDLSQHFTHESHEMYHVVDPPLGLMYLLTHLNKTFGPRIKGKIMKSQVDFDSYEELKELIEDFKPDVIGVRTLNYYRNFFHKAISLVRQWGFAGPVTAGGPYATSSYNTMLQDVNIDLAVLEEGEVTMAELMRLIMNNSNKLPEEETLKNIQGIAFVGKKEKTLQRRINREILLLDHLEEVLSGEPGQNPRHINGTHDLAYIIYTSGSTGIPRGVMVQHGNVVNQITGLQRRFQLDAAINYLVLAAFTFDVSVMHMFLPLTTGAKFYLISEEIKKDPLKLWQFIHEQNINLLNIVPAFMKAILENIEKKKIQFKYLFVGGDVFDTELYKKLTGTFAAETIINIYGPTETTINAALYPCGAVEDGQRIPIGKPLVNYKIYILDNDLNPAPVGADGELCISGRGVARGYLNHPQLTAEKFINYKLQIANKEETTSPHSPYSPYSPYSTIYRSGDRARWLPDGNIEFLGRQDHQIKIRGFRIELGEIEKRFLEMEEVNDVVVLVKEDKSGDKYICAFIISEKDLVISELRECLAVELPNYMLPTYIARVEQFPFKPSGKIDTRALLESKFQVSSRYMPPTNEIERTLTEIWSAVLGMEKEAIGIQSNFFDLGGHSLKATILISKIHKQLEVKVPLVELFKAPTIKGLASHIMEIAGEQAEQQDKFIAIEPAEEREYYVLSSAQQRLYIMQQMDPTTTGYNMVNIVTWKGKGDKQGLEQVFKMLIARHQSLRTSFIVPGQEPVQLIHQKIDFAIEYYEAKEEDRVREIIRDFIRPFDLAETPLLRVGLVMDAHRSTSILLVDMHHIITDGISHNLLTKEFMQLYSGQPLPRLPLQYRDYSQWQQGQMLSGTIKEQEKYWLTRFQGEIPVLNLPTDYSRPGVRSFEGGDVGFQLGPEETNALYEMASSQEATLFMVLLAVFNILLSKICNQEDIVVGTPAAGRRHADLEGIIGMFVNMLALRNCPGKEKTFSDFLKEVKENTLAAFENQDYPFEDLVEKVARYTEREAGRSPVFDVVFALESMDAQPEKAPRETREELNLHPYRYENKATKFDLSLMAVAKGKRLEFIFQYYTKIFDLETVNRLIDYFKGTLAFILKDPGTKISGISLIDERDKDLLVKKMRDENYDFIDADTATSEGKTKLEADFDY